MILELRI